MFSIDSCVCFVFYLHLGFSHTPHLSTSLFGSRTEADQQLCFAAQHVTNEKGKITIITLVFVLIPVDFVALHLPC